MAHLSGRKDLSHARFNGSGNDDGAAWLDGLSHSGATIATAENVAGAETIVARMRSLSRSLFSTVRCIQAFDNRDSAQVNWSKPYGLFDADIFSRSAQMALKYSPPPSAEMNSTAACSSLRVRSEESSACFRLALASSVFPSRSCVPAR
jgi:hypothetical protein